MFSSLGLFKTVTCPKQEECSLPACIFSHEAASLPSSENASAQEYDPFGAGDSPTPPAKRRKVEHAPSNLNNDVPVTPGQHAPDLSSTKLLEPSIALASQTAAASPSSLRTVPIDDEKRSPSKQLATSQRPVSPPPTKAKPPAEPVKPVDKVKLESLIPRPVPRAPDLLKKRLAILQSLHQQLVAQNGKVATGDPKWKSWTLNEQELVKFALEEEETAARKYESEIYRNHITQLVFRIKKMTEEQWRSFVTETIRKKGTDDAKLKPKSAKLPAKPTTGLASPAEEFAVLRSLRTSLAGLEEYGYVTKQPTAAEIDATVAALTSSAGWEKCERCDTRFQVFPGRDDQGRLTSGGSCRYHWAKWTRPAAQKTDRTNGRAGFIYPCCNTPVGSDGCTEADTHVYKVTDKKRLATVLQFEHTPSNSETRPTPVSFDCEMGYTTLGMEVIRVTAVSWPKGEELLDVLVRPYGEVLDLNTRFSGVAMKDFMAAPTYEGSSLRDGSDIADPSEITSLRKVESPAAARELLFNLITPETPLIGHAIDNDLNVIRIIHPLVIDTVLLYPHPRGLPVRFGLKALASKHLDRHIQAGGATGHDSKEDAIATGDLVTVALAEKWKRMKWDGWKFEGEILVAPTLAKKTPAPGRSAL